MNAQNLIKHYYISKVELVYEDCKDNIIRNMKKGNVKYFHYLSTITENTSFLDQVISRLEEDDFNVEKDIEDTEICLIISWEHLLK